VGATGTLLVSVDGVVWEAQQSRVTTVLRAVGFAQDRATIVGAEGTLLVPGLGTNWNRAWTPSYISLNAIACVDSLRVVVGDAGVVLTATDPVNWTQQNNQAVTSQYVAVLDKNGFLVTNFNSTVDLHSGILLSTTPTVVRAIAQTPEGRLIVGGSFMSVDFARVADIARLAPNGTRDTNFNIGTGVGGATAPSALRVQPDGKILVAGDFTSVNGVPMNRIARLKPDGSLDSEFTPGQGADRLVACLALQSDGRILIGGDFNQIDRLQRRPVARLNPDGTPDATFDPGTGPAFNSLITALAVQSDGKVLINGSRERLMRLNTNGTPDTTFNIGNGALGGYVNAILALEDGSIVVGGSFTNISDTTANRMAWLQPDGQTSGLYHQALGSAADGSVDVLALQWDQNEKRTFIVAGGGFTTFNGVPRGRILRLELNGRLDPEFDYGIGPDKNVTGIAWYWDNPTEYTYLGGDFTTFGGLSRSRLARLIGVLSLDPGFNTGPGPNGRVTAMAAQDDGRLLVGGAFTTIDYAPWPNFVRMRKGDSTPPPITQWKAQFFSPEELADPQVSGDDADPDHDGIPNLFEFGYGLDPKTTSRAGLPVGQIAHGAADGKDYFVLLLHRRIGASGLQYGIEVSDDLMTWVSAAARVEVIDTIPDIGNSTETVRVRLTPSIQELPRAFMRVVVSRQ
jgi:uncharacterized delta-60 repeat protein